MKRMLPLILVVTAVAPGLALAHGKGHTNRAHKLHATLTPVQADVVAYSPMSGKADLLANKRNAKSSLHARGLVPRATYTWAVVQGTDANTVCASGTPLPNWKYKRLRANGAGNANSTGSAKHNKFHYSSTAVYAAVVYQTGKPGEVLLCGVFKAKSKKKPSHHGKPTHHSTPTHPTKPAGGHGKSH